jgi:hypothetical protein
MRRAPVPEMVWVTAMQSSLRGVESAPYASLRAALVKLGTPVMPAYSLSSDDLTIFSSASLTDGRT